MVKYNSLYLLKMFSVCLLGSSVIKRVEILYLTIGFVGLGFGLIYLPAMCSVTSSFDKLRSRATGVAATGPSLGNFLISPVLTYLLREYFWQKTLMIYGIIVLCCSAFGFFFKTVENEKKKEILLKKIKNSEKDQEQNIKDLSDFQKVVFLLKNSVFLIFIVTNFLVR